MDELDIYLVDMKLRVTNMKKYDPILQFVLRVGLATEFAQVMHKMGKAYHWDDCATDIIGLPHGEPIFTEKQALDVNEIVAELHCDELFEESNRLLGNEE